MLLSVINFRLIRLPVKGYLYTTGLAANVAFNKSGGFKPCVLRSTSTAIADHPIYKCTIFIDPRSKIDKLKSLNACVRCANFNHRSADCKFRFSSFQFFVPFSK